MSIPEREGVKEKSCVGPKVHELIRTDLQLSVLSHLNPLATWHRQIIKLKEIWPYSVAIGLH